MAMKNFKCRSDHKLYYTYMEKKRGLSNSIFEARMLHISVQIRAKSYNTTMQLSITSLQAYIYDTPRANQ